MLLVLYREYVQRCSGRFSTLTYFQWLYYLKEEAAEWNMSLGDFIRDDIDPTYQGS